MTATTGCVYDGSMPTKTRKTRTCANPKCRKSLTGRGNQKYCSPKCASVAAYARKQADHDANGPLVDLCFGCRHPNERQAEPITIGGKLPPRHPSTMKHRPEHSGYCADSVCPCVKCRPENATREPEVVPKSEARTSEGVGTCPLPRYAKRLTRPGIDTTTVRKLITAHKRSVRDGTTSCSCSKIEGSAA